MTRRRPIPVQIRALVATDARHRCGYCLAPEVLMGTPMTIDHIVPEAAGGRLERANLWLACNRCNTYKAAQVEAKDTATGQLVRLFNPRVDDWWEHFAWSADGTRMVGRSSCGRATIAALHLNNDHIVATRRQWVEVGWWPPDD